MHKKITYSGLDATGILKDFSKLIKVKSSKKGLTVQAASGEGTIKTIALPNGIIVLEITTHLKEAIKLDAIKLNNVYILTYKETVDESENTSYAFYLGNENTNNSTDVSAQKTKLIQLFFETKVLMSYFTQKQIQLLLQNALLQNPIPESQIINSLSELANEILFYDHTSYSDESFIQTRVTEMMEIFINEVTIKQPLPV